jgi:MFS family permease
VRNSDLLVIYIPTLIISFGMGMLVPVIPLYALSFQVPYTIVGIILAAHGLGNLIGDVPAGILLGRIGQKWSMLLGIGTLGVATLAMSWASTWQELVVYGLVAGVGSAMWGISRHAYITSTAKVHQRGRANAIFGGLGRIGSFTGPLVGGAIGATFGLRAPFVAFAVVAAVALVASAIFIVDTGMVVQHRGGVLGHSRHLVSVVREHLNVLIPAGSGQLFAQMIRAGRTAIVPLYAAEILGLDIYSVSLIVTFSAGIDMLMFYPAGMIMDRYGRKWATVPSFVLQAVGMALIPLTGTFGGLLAATLVIGFGNGLGSGTMLTLGSDLAPKESMGEFLGVWRLIGDTGHSGAPLVVGGMAQLLGLAPATLVIAGVGFAAALILGMLVPETLTSRVPPVEVKAKA